MIKNYRIKSEITNAYQENKVILQLVKRLAFYEYSIEFVLSP